MRDKEKGMSLAAKGMTDEEGPYQVWSPGSDNDEMRNPTHGAMLARFKKEDEEKATGNCFVSTTAR